MEEQKDLGSYDPDGTADAVSQGSTESHPYAFLNGNYRNAEAWTNEYMRLHGDKLPDWGNLIGWFANAIETQHFDTPPSPNPLPTTEGVTQGRLTTIQSPLPDWAEDERAAILEQLDMIEKHYRAQAQPYMDRLAKLEGYRPPPTMFIRSDTLPPPPGQ